MDDLISDFIAETREGLETLDGELVHFERRPDDPALLGGIFRLIHTIKGTCGFLGLSRLQTVAHAAENVLGAFRDGELEVSPTAVSAILETVDLIRTLIDALSETGMEPAGSDAALIARLEAVLMRTELRPAQAATKPLIDRLGGDATVDAAAEMAIQAMARQDFADQFAAVDPDLAQSAIRDVLCATARGEGDARPKDLERLASIIPGPQSAAAVAALLLSIGESLAALEAAPEAIDILIQRLTAGAPTDAASVATVMPPAAATSEGVALIGDIAAAGERSDGEPVQVQQTIRVSVDALEHLMTVVSELVLIRNQLIQTLRLDPESPFAAPLNRLNQVTSELQEGVMTTRMQPISGAWAKAPRLVRDLAKELNKQVDLLMSGQETELDRQVLELIKDPLTHMIRNAVDHGLEEPAERLAAGKPATGRLTLAARHEGGAIVIEVTDDGRGLSAARIRSKAIACGLGSPGDIEAMSDADVRRFIFAAGFSTASQVTAVSGRGVGMDVVRTNIEKIGGAIEVTSVEGQGSRFTIRIPLTLTIVSALIVESCGERFAMPQSSVIELVSANDASGRSIEHIDGTAVLRLRDRLLPLVSLQAFLGLEANCNSIDETSIVVARVGAFDFGIVVDRVFDTEEIVVKPVASVLRHLKLYSGATILGDGSVILILDFKGLSVEAGGEQASGSAVQDDEALAAQPIETDIAMLVFRAADGALKATPLSGVSRIEEVDDAQLERVDGRVVVQYRGRLMPVAGIDRTGAPALAEGQRHPLLVFARTDQSVGLLVSEIIDIVHCSPTLDLGPGENGALGSLIVAGVATEMLDIDYLWKSQGGAAQAEPEAGAKESLRRLLVIDPSPFTELLLQPMLKRAGYAVTVAPDAEAALTLHARGETFELILADSLSQGPDAHQFALTLRQATAWRATPFMGLSRESLAAGPDELRAESMMQAVSNVLDQGLRGAA